MEKKCGLKELIRFDEQCEIDLSIGPIPESVTDGWDEKRALLEDLPHCGKCEHCLEAAREDAAWRREMAMEAGMLHGVSAYNEAMGWEPEFEE